MDHKAATHDTLIRDLEKYATWEPADSPRAAAMREAAKVLRETPVKRSDGQRLDDEAFAIKGYRIDTAEEAKHMRVVFFSKAGNKDVLGYLEMVAPASYDFATDILKRYDELEGIK